MTVVIISITNRILQCIKKHKEKPHIQQHKSTAEGYLKSNNVGDEDDNADNH